VVLTPSRSRLHYAWIVFGVCFLTLLAAAGIRSTPGVLLVPLEREFAWSPATVSAAVAINLVVFGLCGPFAAAFMARYGIRRVMVAALLLIAVGVGLTTAMRTAWQLYVLWGLIVGTGTGSIVSVLAATVGNRWFVARRGLVVGVLTAAGATGQLIFLPTLATLTVSHGWRWASVAVAVAALTAVPLVLVLMRDDPSDVGLPAYGATRVEVPPPPPNNVFSAALGGLSLGLKDRSFYLLAGSFFICGATTNGLIGTHLIPASMDHGMPEVTAASMLALIGIFDVVGTIVSGGLTDRLDSRWLLFWYYGLRGISLLLLPFALSSSYLALLFFMVFYGLDWVATVPPTIALATQNFGKQNGSIVFGWIFSAHQLGAAFAALSAGAMRTWLGDYQLTFISAGLLCLIASGLVIRIRRPVKIPPPSLAPEPA
jgi:MFS family permease